MRKIKKNFLRLVVILSLVLVTVGLAVLSAKIITTGAEIWRYNDNIRFYNESPVKSDAFTEWVEGEYAARDAMYNSEDLIVRMYSNSWFGIKIASFGLAVAFYPMAVLFWVCFIRESYVIMRKKYLRSKLRSRGDRKKKNI